jgi:hypothetical protein
VTLKKSHKISAAFFLTIVYHASGLLGEETSKVQLSGEQLIELGSRLSSAEGKWRNFYVSGSVAMGRTDRGFHFRLYWRQPDQYWLLWEDLADGMPLMLYANGKSLVYDPVPGAVKFNDGTPATLIIRAGEGNKLHIELSGSERTDLDVDLRSLAAGATEDRHITREVGGTYIMSGKTKHRSLVRVWVNPALSCPFTKLELFNVEMSLEFPMIRIETAKANEAQPEDRLRFPSEKDLPDTIPIMSPADAQELWPRAGALPLLRYAIRHPEDRALVEEKLGKIDWEAAAAHDAAIGPALKRFVKQYEPRLAKADERQPAGSP